MAKDHVAPGYMAQAFHCPKCGVYAYHWWHPIIDNPSHERLSGEPYFSACVACHGASYWEQGKLVYPELGMAPPCHDEAPPEIAELYIEASGIAGRSPRAAAALLRLAVQLLMPHLGQKGENLNNDIAALVKLGLPVQIQMALDAIRVIGNNSVHPGEIQVNEDPDTAAALFGYINQIVEHMVAGPKRLQELYESLPEGARAAIEKRDGK